MPEAAPLPLDDPRPPRQRSTAAATDAGSAEWRGASPGISDCPSSGCGSPSSACSWSTDSEALLYAAFWFFVPLGIGGVGDQKRLAGGHGDLAGRPPQTGGPQAGPGPDRRPAPHGHRVHGLRGQRQPGQRDQGLSRARRAGRGRCRPRLASGGQRPPGPLGRGGPPAPHPDPAAHGRRRPARHGRCHRRLRPAGLGRPPGRGPPGRASRPRRHHPARRSLPGPHDPGPVRGAADAHPRPGARRGRRCTSTTPCCTPSP